MPDGSDVIRELLISIGVIVDPDAEGALDRLNAATDRVRENALKLARATGGTTAATANLKEEQRLAKVEVDRANEALERQRRTAQQVTSAVGTLTRGLIGATTALAGLVAGGVALATSAAGGAERIERQAAALRLSTDAVQELDFAFGVFDANGDLFAQTLITIANRAEQALQGNQGLAESFGVLGLTLTELRALEPAARFEALAEGLASADDEGAALAATFQILGEDVGRRLTPLLLEGAAGVRQLRQEARDLGLVTEQETLKAGAELALQWRRLTQIGRALREEIGQALLPTVGRMVDRTLAWVRANREIISQRLQLFVEGLAGAMKILVPIVLGLTTGFVALRAAIFAVGVGRALVQFAAANPILAAFVVVVGLVVAGLVALALQVEDVIVWLRGGDSAIGEALRVWSEWIPFGERIYDIFAAIADVIRSVVRASGRLGAAFVRNTPLVRGLLEHVERFTEKFGLVSGFLDAVSSIVDARLGNVAEDLRGVAASVDTTSVAASAAIDARGAAQRTTNNTTTNNLNQNVTVESPGGVDGGTASFLDGILRNGRAATAGGFQ